MSSKIPQLMVRRRLASKVSRKDFLTTLVGELEKGSIEKEELTAHVSTLACVICHSINSFQRPTDLARIAGGETVSTFLAGATYYLLKDPQRFDKLKQEVRSRFSAYSEINATAAQQLPYLQAVIHEGLRIYPPGSQGFPRISPGTFVGSHWVPPGVSTCCLTAVGLTF